MKKKEIKRRELGRKRDECIEDKVISWVGVKRVCRTAGFTSTQPPCTLEEPNSMGSLQNSGS